MYNWMQFHQLTAYKKHYHFLSLNVKPGISFVKYHIHDHAKNTSFLRFSYHLLKNNSKYTYKNGHYCEANKVWPIVYEVGASAPTETQRAAYTNSKI